MLAERSVGILMRAAYAFKRLPTCAERSVVHTWLTPHSWATLIPLVPPLGGISRKSSPRMFNSEERLDRSPSTVLPSTHSPSCVTPTLAGGIIQQMKDGDFTMQRGDITIELAKSYGFCWGVERAVQMAFEARKQYPETTMHITNEIIHNPIVNQASGVNEWEREAGEEAVSCVRAVLAHRCSRCVVQHRSACVFACGRQFTAEGVQPGLATLQPGSHTLGVADGFHSPTQLGMHRAGRWASCKR